MAGVVAEPRLKTRSSVRERLKAWQKPPQTVTLQFVAEESSSKPRFVYQPKHAAADFSRLPVSPSSAAARQRLPSPTQGLLAEDDPQTLAPRASTQSRSGHRDEDRAGSPRDEQSERWRAGSSAADRHSYTLVEEPFQAPNSPAHAPARSRPGTWSQPAPPPPANERSPPSSSVARPLSDFELFMARAEAEERAWREQVLRSTSIPQRSAAAAAAAYPANRGVWADPHRQFVPPPVASSSAAAERSHQRPQRHHHHPGGGSRHRVVASGSGSGSGRERERMSQPPPQQQQGPGQDQQQGRDGHNNVNNVKAHGRHWSWAAETVVERQKAPVVARPSQQQRPEPPQPRRTPEPVRGNEEDLDRARESQPQPQPQPARALRRQASLTQRIAQYIRPGKSSAVRPIETLVE
ncbi:hypothetical protein N658DRAFT_518196 [Parathielavia hyrcaniae]|uniref:Uncharacterized protein n=1 Tax=Parathielavia hyrcaniae TaxID=113614 RepID=A0AAN6PUE0_9PEZI|nr:hypothetical protein N658DRAFT_518196 [Parathielavia hyrcaniae]